MLADYIPFIILLVALFAVAGGIYLQRQFAGAARASTRC